MRVLRYIVAVVLGLLAAGYAIFGMRNLVELWAEFGFAVGPAEVFTVVIIVIPALLSWLAWPKKTRFKTESH